MYYDENCEFILNKFMVYYPLSPTYIMFCTLFSRLQNRAMYPLCFIITCNIHFLSNGVTFFDRRRMCSPCDQGQNGHLVQKHPTLFFLFQ